MSIKKAKFFFFAILAAISLFFVLEKNILPGLSSELSPDKSFELLERVIRWIRTEYVEDVNPAKTMHGAFKGLVDSLDILSCYLDRESVLKYSQRKEANLKDIGVILFKTYGTFPQVIGVIENSPSEKKGIQIGDFISNLDGQSTLMMSLSETQLYFKDKENTPITLKILRKNKSQEIILERTLLYKEFYSYTSIKGTSGVLHIHRLYPPCTQKIKEKVLPRIKPQGKALILDLRNCYEGDMAEARKLINLFMKAQKIGYLQKKEGIKEVLSCTDNAELEKLPLIIWTNQATIGPAEAVAGVLQEFKRAKIIGHPTMGLVAKQNFFVLEDGSGLLLTSGIFHLNSRKSLWEKGIKPDVKIESDIQSFNSYLERSLVNYP